MVVDGFVEGSLDGGQTWHRVSVPESPWYPDHDRYAGPWSIPHAIEIARAEWAGYANAPFRDRVVIRVIDASGVIVEQWPKAK